VNIYDVAIVGGGIIGASCALALAEEGLRVVVLDRQMPGREASWAAGGMLSPAPHLKGDEPLVPLANESLRLYPEFIHSIESAAQKSTAYCHTGAIELFFGPEAPAERDRYVAACRMLNVDAEAISATEARRREPSISSTARAAAFFPAEGTVEPRSLMEATIEGARAKGAEIHAHCAVRSLLIERNRCVGVIVENERFLADHVVIAAGCYSHEIVGPNASFGSQLAPFLPTRPVRGQMLALWPRDTLLSLVIRSTRGYLISRSNGCIVAGSTLEEAGFEKITTVEGLKKIRRAAVELVPALDAAEVGESWCGLRPGTPDGLPILGPVEIDGVILATGHFRNGVLLAPVTAHLVKDWIARNAPRFPVDAFSPYRFVRPTAQARSVC
jgi:glycine oxidase